MSVIIVSHGSYFITFFINDLLKEIEWIVIGVRLHCNDQTRAKQFEELLAQLKSLDDDVFVMGTSMQYQVSLRKREVVKIRKPQ